VSLRSLMEIYQRERSYTDWPWPACGSSCSLPGQQPTNGKPVAARGLRLHWFSRGKRGAVNVIILRQPKTVPKTFRKCNILMPALP